MNRGDLRRGTRAFGAPARLVVAGAIGALLLLAALNPPGAGASPTDQDPGRAHSSYFVQREAAVAPSATNPARSHRLALLGAFLVAAGAAAVAERRTGSRDRRSARRHVEQFNIRRRGPPYLLVAHVTH